MAESPCTASLLWQNFNMKLFSWIRAIFSWSPDVHIKLQLRFPILVFLVLLAAAFALPDRVWNTLLIGFGGMFMVAYVWVWFLGHYLLGYRKMHAGWVAVGDRLEETFYLENNCFFPALWVEVVDESNVPGYVPTVVRSVGSDGSDFWRNSAICVQRGAYRLGPWLIRAGDPFGIFTMTRRFNQTEEIIIHPPVHAPLQIPLPAGQSDGRTRSTFRTWKATINSASVRDYQPNDPMRWIHWPTSARRDDLFVREFDLDAAGDIWIFLDLQEAVQLGSGMEGTEEHAVLLAATLAVQGLGNVRNVGLATYGLQPQVISAGRGRGQQWRILRALALVQANGEWDITLALEDLGRVARRGSAAVIVTANGSMDWLPSLISLGRRGIDSTVVLLERESFGGAGNTAVLKNAIQHLDFGCYVVRQGELGNPLVDRREDAVQYRVTPMGKVVVVPN